VVQCIFVMHEMPLFVRLLVLIDRAMLCFEPSEPGAEQGVPVPVFAGNKEGLQKNDGVLQTKKNPPKDHTFRPRKDTRMSSWDSYGGTGPPRQNEAGLAKGPSKIYNYSSIHQTHVRPARIRSRTPTHTEQAHEHTPLPEMPLRMRPGFRFYALSSHGCSSNGRLPLTVHALKDDGD
jgi:hypothetical protein